MPRPAIAIGIPAIMPTTVRLTVTPSQSSNPPMMEVAWICRVRIDCSRSGQEIGQICLRPYPVDAPVPTGPSSTAVEF